MRRFIGALSVVTLAAAGLTLGGGSAGAANDRSPVPWARPAWVAAATPAAAVADTGDRARVPHVARSRPAPPRPRPPSSDPTNAQYHHYLTPDQVRARFGPTHGGRGTGAQWLDRRRPRGRRRCHRTRCTCPPPAPRPRSPPRSPPASPTTPTGVAGCTPRPRRRPRRRRSPPTSPGLGPRQHREPQDARPHRRSRPQPRAARPRRGPRAPRRPRAAPGGGTAVDRVPQRAAVLDSRGPRSSTPPIPSTRASPNPMPYVPCGYVPVAAARRVRHRPRRRRRQRRPRRAGRGRRRVRVAHRARRPARLRADLRRRRTRSVRASTPSASSPRPIPSLEDPDQCDASGWYGEQTLDIEAVHAMAPGANAPLRRRRELPRRRPRRRAQRRGRPPPRRHRHQLLRQHAARTCPRPRSRRSTGSRSRPRSRASASTSRAATTATRPRSSAGPRPTSRRRSPLVTAVGGTSLGVDAERPHGDRAGLGDRARVARPTAGGSRAYPGEFLYGSGGGASRLYAEPDYQRAVVPDALAKVRASSAAGWCPTSPSSATRTPACSSARPRRSATACTSTCTASAARACRARCSPGSWRSPTNARATPHGFANPALYRLVPLRRVHRRRTREPAGDGDGSATRTTRTRATASRLGARPRLSRSSPSTPTPGYDNVTGMGTPWGPTFLLLLGAR